jgi:hypothetical protein
VCELPVLVIDGAAFSDFEGFARQFTRLLNDYTRHGNLDAFDDIPGGTESEDGILLELVQPQLLASGEEPMYWVGVAGQHGFRVPSRACISSTGRTTRAR